MANILYIIFIPWFLSFVNSQKQKIEPNQIVSFLGDKYDVNQLLSSPVPVPDISPSNDIKYCFNQQNNVWQLNCSQESVTNSGNNNQTDSINKNISYISFLREGNNLNVPEKNLTIETSRRIVGTYYPEYLKQTLYFVSFTSANDTAGTLFGVKIGNFLKGDVQVLGRVLLRAKHIPLFESNVRGIHFDVNTGDLLVATIESDGKRTIWQMLKHNNFEDKNINQNSIEQPLDQCLPIGVFKTDTEKISIEFQQAMQSAVKSLQESVKSQCQGANSNASDVKEIKRLQSLIKGCEKSITILKQRSSANLNPTNNPTMTSSRDRFITDTP